MRDLSIVQREEGGVTVLALSGPLTASDKNPRLKVAVKGLLNRGTQKILIAMEEVPYLDSSGVMELVLAHTSARKMGV